MRSELLLMAGYHAWAFERLYAALVPLDDAAYRDDCGLFFRTIHGTLNHLLLADRVWFARFQGERYEVAGLDSELEGDRVLLEHALADQAPGPGGHHPAAMRRNSARSRRHAPAKSARRRMGIITSRPSRASPTVTTARACGMRWTCTP